MVRYDLYIEELSYIAGTSFLTLIPMYISSIVYKFCKYHRMFIHYILTHKIVATIDMYIGIPLDDSNLLILYLIIAGIFAFLALYLHQKYGGRKYDFNKAKDVCDRYRGIIPSSVTHADVYVAINLQYHDYCELFKAWFGDSVDTKIIESAINFWFKDDDFVDGNKVWMYFMDL